MSRIAVFVINNPLASHYALFAYKDTLTRIGHEVNQFSFPSNAIQNVDAVRLRMPSIDTLNTYEVILVGFHEYVQPWLAAIYGFATWSKLKVPVIARFDESMDRLDLGLPARVPELLRWAQHYSFPAAQDAKKYGGQWLPFGADTTIFKPQTLGVDGPIIETKKKYDLGFIGTLYPYRKQYLDCLVQHIGSGIGFHCGNVFVQDLGGIRARESTELLAENYRQIKIFVCLPAMSRLIVEKTLDVLASGAFCMYPRLFGESEANLVQFKDREEIVYYDVGQFVENGKQIQYYLSHDEEREKIARAGCELVHSKYTLEAMLNQILSMVGKGASA